MLNPSGMCQCGCGRKAPLAQRTDQSVGYVKGEPVRYVARHQGRRRNRGYEVRDCGYETPCWVWTLQRNRQGYGRIGGKLAHRVMYEDTNGPVTPGLDLHHKCENPGCVNPDHLEPLTRAEHARLGGWAVRTHCHRGHPFDEANTYRRPDGARVCRRCTADRQATYQARKAAV